MADIRGIELASEIYSLEDTSARNTATAASQTATQAGQTATQASQTATQASQTASAASQTAEEADEKIGNLANLETTAKTNLVAAINEVHEGVSEINKQIKNVSVTSQAISKKSETGGLTKLASVTVPKNSVVTITVAYWNINFIVDYFRISEENKDSPYPVFIKPVSAQNPQDGFTVTLCNTDNADRSFGVFFNCSGPSDTDNQFYLMVSTMSLND